MMKKTFALAALLALVAAPLVLAHEPPGPNERCEHAQNPHDYGSSGSGNSGSQSTGRSRGGAADARDHHKEDCGGDGSADTGGSGDLEYGFGLDLDGIWPEGPAPRADLVPGWEGCAGACAATGEPVASDGDYEYGLGGGFFPAGIWAADPICDYGLTPHHGPSFWVESSIPAGAAARFTVGADPTPPTLVPSTDADDDDGFDCVTDGGVTPDLDLDDCMEEFVSSGTTTCPPGGDGGWWVWIDCIAQTEGDDASLGLTDVDGDGIPDGADPRLVPPTGATVECALAGHIWSG